MAGVYTKTGDSGQTGLFGGTRVAKQSLRVEAYGTVDESNAAIGAAKAALTDEGLRARLHEIQQRLFVLAAELAADSAGREVLDGVISETDVTGLEGLIDECLAETGPQRAFVVPGREPISAALHQARTVVRRAEREVLRLAEVESVRGVLVKYLNRLSDALYSVARVVEERFTRAQIEDLVRETVVRELGGLELTHLDLAVAKELAAAAEARADEMGVPVVVAVVDASGTPLLLHRQDESLLVSVDLAVNKAYTAVALRLPTDQVGRAAADSLPGIENADGGRIVLFGGGAPLWAQEQLLGGIGVSGGTVAQDMDIVQAALGKRS